jgi:hypothetical protein
MHGFNIPGGSTRNFIAFVNTTGLHTRKILHEAPDFGVCRPSYVHKRYEITGNNLVESGPLFLGLELGRSSSRAGRDNCIHKKSTRCFTRLFFPT